MDIHWKILLGLLAFPALIAGILVWLHIQNFRTRHWLEANGRIVSSKAAAKMVRKLDRSTGDSDHSSTTTERFETKNVAEIAYEFSAAGRTVQGSRIDLGAGSGSTEVAKTLKRYPQGKIVRVLYDPDDPASCILERHDPRKLRQGWLAVVVLSASQWFVARGWAVIAPSRPRRLAGRGRGRQLLLRRGGSRRREPGLGRTRGRDAGANRPAVRRPQPHCHRR